MTASARRTFWHTISFALTRLLPVLALVCLGIVTCIKAPFALAQDSPTIRKVSAVPPFELCTYQDEQGHSAYCLDGHMRGPGQGLVYNKGWEWAKDGVAYCAYYGYPHTTTICGYSLSKAEANMATQFALWMYRGFIDRNGIVLKANELPSAPVGSPLYDFTKRSDTFKAATRALLDNASAYKSGQNPAIDQFAKVYFTPDNKTQNILLVPSQGSLELIKTSADPELVTGNSAYSMKGAVFEIWEGIRWQDAKNTGRAFKIQDPETSGQSVTARGVDIHNPDSTTITLPEGTYWLLERASDAGPKNYAISKNPIQVQVKPNDTTKVGVSPAIYNTPQYLKPSILIKKKDSSTPTGAPQGPNTLKDAHFKVSFYKTDALNDSSTPDKTWVFKTDEKGVAYYAKDYLVEGDDLIYNNNQEPVLPFGTLVIEEIKAPEGYKVMDTKIVKTLKANNFNDLAFEMEPIEIAEDVLKGGVSIKKVDAQTGSAQGDATLEGAEFSIASNNEYEIYIAGKPYKKGEIITTITTGKDGIAKTADEVLPYGNYTISESKPPRGYKLNEAFRQDFSINKDCTYADLTIDDKACKNDVIRGGVQVAKLDEETKSPKALGAATLEDAVFNIELVSNQDVVIKDKTFHTGEVVATIKPEFIDGVCIAKTEDDLLSFGTYRVYEESAPTGYLKKEKDAWSQTFNITEDKTYIKTLIDSEHACYDQVIRGDISFNKIDGRTSEGLAFIPFKLTSLTTGESHLIVTDKQGHYSSESSVVKHSANTNGNDAAFDAEKSALDETKLSEGVGLWFAGAKDQTTQANDELGALPYDSYRLEELRCSVNKGLDLIKTEFVITKHHTTVDIGKIADNHIDLSSVFTTQNGQRSITSPGEIDCIDRVAFTNLDPETTYTLKTEVHLRSSDGKDLGCVKLKGENSESTSSSFKPKTKGGTAEVSVSLQPLTLSEGQSLVCYETLYEGNLPLKEHRNIDDENQTIPFKPVKPYIPKTGATTVFGFLVLLSLLGIFYTTYRIKNAKQVYEIW